MSATGNGFGRLGVAPEPLCDLVTALSPYGLPLQFLDRALHLIRRNATLHALARRLTRRPTDEPGGGVIPAVPLKIFSKKLAVFKAVAATSQPPENLGKSNDTKQFPLSLPAVYLNIVCGGWG